MNDEKCISADATAVSKPCRKRNYSFSDHDIA
jgi:hypothetical protein